MFPSFFFFRLHSADGLDNVCCGTTHLFYSIHAAVGFHLPIFAWLEMISGSGFLGKSEVHSVNKGRSIGMHRSRRSTKNERK